MTLPTFSDPRLRSACQDRCAEFGDPACYGLTERGKRNNYPIEAIKPCGECLRDIGVEPGDEFDESAAIGKLL